MKNTLNINREDFDQICRCCLKKGPLASLLEVMYENITFVEIFLSVFGEQIDFNDELPKCVCETCLGDIIRCYDLKRKYHVSLKTLATIIENSVASATADESEPAENIEEILSVEEPKIVDPDVFTRNRHTEDGLDVEENVKLDEDITDTEDGLDVEENKLDEDITDTEDGRRSEKHKPYTCDICNKSFMLKATLKVHKRIHSLLTAAENENSDSEKEESKSKPEPKSYTCVICSKIFGFRHQLIKHKREENHNAPSKIECEKCNKLISRLGKSIHMRTCHSDEKPFICEYCGMAFPIKKNLSRHVMTHTGERPHLCEICGKGFIQKTSLIEHGRSHTGDKPFLCDYCGETFSHQNSYKNHLTRHTDKQSSGEISLEKVMAFQCKICDKFYSSKLALRRHMTLHTDTGQKDFRCHLCGKSFRHYSNFKYHQTIHNEKRPVTCKICSKTFRLMGHLRVHLRTHTREKPYPCPYCDKSFAQATTRTSHVRLHTGERPYACDVCSKRFYTSSTMTKHRQTHFKNGAGIKFSTCEENE